jgi:ubiquinone/menaquinone biosynthesis C-methylase UbiE
VSEYDAAAFDAFESSGWEAIAATYDEHWSALTTQAIEPLLDAARVQPGMRVLDVGAGAGYGAARAAARGAQVTGVDVAEAMVKLAARQHPDASFVQASATSLPFDDESFDAAVGNLVILHVGQPELAMRELWRVLAPGGRVALSTWESPERSPFFAALHEAVAEVGIQPPPEVPAGPSFFRFADEQAFRMLLEDVGFSEIDLVETVLDLHFELADEVLRALEDGTVRTRALVRAADGAQRNRVRQALEAQFEPWRRGNTYLIPLPVKIAGGTKATP